MWDEQAQRNLAAAVIRRAVNDAAGIIEPWRYSVSTGRRVDRVAGRRPVIMEDGVPLTKERIREEATRWISRPSDELEFWCHLAGIEMDALTDHHERAVAYAQAHTRMKK